MTSKQPQISISALISFIRFIYAIHYSISDDGVIRKFSIYIILGISCTGYKKIFTILVYEHKSAKYQHSIHNEHTNRRVKDIMIFYADGLTGIKVAIFF